MKFKVDFTKDLTWISMGLLVSELFLLVMLFLLVLHFIWFDIPSAKYYRALGTNIVFILIFACLYKDNK